MSLPVKACLRQSPRQRHRWAESCGYDCMQGGEGIQIINKDEAQVLAERAGLDEDDLRAAGFAVVEG